ncbi:MAG: dTDP-4-dehydrorhamnose reductase [Hamadaea sp.]|nr:dTDP-4-dehydrorhamnose reductase [Hamadaea sp.]
MKVLITGAAGMLGRDLVDAWSGRDGAEVTAAARAELDITDPDAAAAAVAGHDLVINAAAWTDVDGAEAHEAQATAVNGDGPAVLAAVCATTGARLVQVSTDYVFPGDASAPYAENAPTAPVNAYGRGKLAGEHAVLRLLPDSGYVVRTAWLYAPHGRNFATTMLRLAETRDTLDVVDDQHGQPTWTGHLAEQIVALGLAALAGRAPAGVYHGTASGQTTWYAFAQAVFAQAGLDPARIRPTTSEAFPRPARRPAYSVLGHEGWRRAGLAPMPDWREGLSAAFGGLLVGGV